MSVLELPLVDDELVQDSLEHLELVSQYKKGEADAAERKAKAAAGRRA